MCESEKRVNLPYLRLSCQCILTSLNFTKPCTFYTPELQIHNSTSVHNIINKTKCVVLIKTEVSGVYKVISGDDVT